MSEITGADVHSMTEHDQKQIRDWLRDHRLNPDMTMSVYVVGPLAIARVLVLDDQGRMQRDPRHPDEPWTRRRWRWRRAPMPQVHADPPTSGE